MKKSLHFFMAALMLSALSLSGQLTAPFTESFNGTSIPTGWTNTSTNASAAANWKFSGTPGNPPMTSSQYVPPVILDHTQNGGGIAWSDGSVPAVADCGLMTDSIDISSLTSLYLQFFYYSNNVTGAGNNTFRVDFYDGTTWHDSVFLYSGNGTGWQFGGLDLSSYTTTGKVLFEFVLDQTTMSNAFYNDVLIDDISVMNVPPCPLVTGLAVNNVSATTAELDWIAVTGATSYEVIYDTLGFDPATSGTSSITSHDSLVLSSLAGATDYQFYVIPDCGVNGLGDTAGPVSFKTLCIPFTAPYSNNFDTDPTGNPPSCWAAGLAGPNANFMNTNVTNFTGPRSTPNHLGIYSYALSASDTAMAITAQFTDLTAKDKQISFYAKSPNGGNGLIIGTLSSQTDPSSFTALDTIMVSASYNEYIFYFDSLSGYNGVDEYIGLMHNNGSTFSTIYVDDFDYDVIPPCPKPTAISLVSKTDTTATITYTGTGGPYDIFWGPTGFVQGSPGLGLITSSSNPHTIDSLLVPGGCYDVYVRKNCGVNGLSAWAGPLTFCTNCATQSLPYYESFDVWPLSCWDTLGGSQYWAEYVPFGGPPSGIAEANFWGWPDPNDGLLTSAPIDVSTQAQVRFQWAHLYSSTYPDDALAVTVEKNGSGIWDTVAYLTGTTFSSPGAQNTAPPTSQPFNEEIIVLDSVKYTGHTIRVRLWAISDYGPDLFVDNFYVEAVPSCIPPGTSSLGVSFVNSNSADVFWAGGAGVSSNVQWGPVGFTPGVGNPTGSVLGSDSTYLITMLMANTDYEFYVQDSCTGSAGLSGWVGPFAFRTACTPFVAPYTENFDGSSWIVGSNGGIGDTIDPCWSRNPGSGFVYDWSVLNGPSIFSFTSGPATDHSGVGNFLYTEVAYGSASDVAYLYSPFVDVSGLTVPYVEFFSHRFGNNLGNMDVEINDGSGWVTMLTLTGQEQNSASDPFEDKGFDISSFGDTIQVRFKATSTGCCSGAMAIDNFSVVEAPSCPKLAGQAVVGVTDSSSSLTWFASANATAYQVWVGPAGFFQGTATVGGSKAIHSSDSVYTDTLSSNTCYEYLVRGICSPGDTSEWVGPITWCTPCVPFNAPYYESYDSWPLNCWNMNGGVNSWQMYSGTGGDNWAEANFWSISTGEYHMTSPVISLNKKSEVHFEWSHLYSSTYPDDQLIVVAQKVGTSVWDTISNLQGSVNFDDPTAGNTSPGAGIKVVYQLDSTKYHNASVIVKLIAVTDFGPDCFVNNFYVGPIITCPILDSLSISNITTTTATAGWTPGGASSPTSYEVSYGPALAAPAAGTKMIVNTNSAQLTSLMSSTSYCYFVRGICSPGDTSVWAGPYCFTTLCTVASSPYATDLTSATIGHWDGLNDCWTIVSNNPGTTSNGGYSWEIRNTTQTTSSGTGPLGDNTNYPALGGTFITADVSGSGTGDSTMFISPLVDLTGSLAPELKYYYHMFGGTTMADLHVDIHNGTSWVRDVHVLTSTYQTAAGDPYIDTTADLSAYIGQTIQVRFRGVSFGCCQGDIALDDISIGDPGVMPTNCPPPTNIDTNVIACDSIEVKWGTAADTAVVAYGPTGGLPTNAMMVIGDSVAYITGTMPNTSYDIYVSNICSGDTSNPTGPITVNTGNVGAPTAAFTNTISGYNVNFDASTSTGMGNSYAWDFGDGNTGTGDMPMHTYTTGGSMTVKLIVSNNCGTDSVTMTLNGISLEEIALGASLAIFPNPATDLVNFELDLETQENVTVKLISISGQLISSQSYGSTDSVKGQLDVSSLANGVYMIKIETDKGTINQRLIKE